MQSVLLVPKNDQREQLSLLFLIPHKVWPQMAQNSKSKRNTSQLQLNPNPFRVICFFPLWCFLRIALKVIPLTNQGLHFPVFKHFFCLIPNSPRIKSNLLKMKSNALYILICFLTSLYTIGSWHPPVLHQIPYPKHYVVITSG